MTNETGGPAFPTEQGEDLHGNWNQTYDPGMSLRQWYAGLALQGWLMNGDFGEDVCVKMAWETADAMIKAGLETRD